MLLPDYPIKKKEKDRLKRSHVATKVAEMLAKFEGEESFVVGVEGPWGSGKTSFVNLVLAELKTKDFIIVPFNPWNFSDQNELITDFFSSLLEKAKKELDAGALDKIISYASKLQISLSPSIPIPHVGSVGVGELWKKSGETSLQKQRDDIDEKLRGLSKKILVVIDDIDRLDKDETRLIMKLVKMTANFPNTIFLLAYDRVRVSDRLKEDGWPGDEFLKKIVQVSFTLPKADQQGMRDILFADLDSTIESIYGKFDLVGEDEKRWSQIVYAGFPELFETVRDIKRYISSLRLNWSVVEKEDVNVIDFMVVEAIRVFFPRLHTLIGANKSFFLGRNMDFISSLHRDNGEKRGARFQEILDEAEIKNKQLRKIIIKILEELFPRLEDGYQGGDWDVIWRNSQRICSDTRFDTYFQLGISSGNVSELDLNAAIDLLSNKKLFSKEVIRLGEEKRLRPTLSRITDKIKTIPKDKLENLVTTLWDLESKIKDQKIGVFDFDDFDTASFRIARFALENFSEKAERKAFLELVVKETTSIYEPLKLIRSIEEEIEKGAADDRVLLTSAEMSDSKEVIVDRIRKWSKLKKKSAKHLPFILYTWKKWSSDDEVKDYVKNLVKTTKGVAFLVDGFVGMTYSSNGNYKDINKQSIAELYPLDDLEKLVTKISNQALSKMTKSEKEAIAVFRNPPKRW